MIQSYNPYIWASHLFTNACWHAKRTEKVLYLTFDDGPHPIVTPFVMNTLASFHAKASFFMLGKQVLQYPQLADRVKEAGHLIGNHSFDHPNGWKTSTEHYMKNIERADEYIHSSYFRPPYGRLRYKQYRQIQSRFRIIMWDVLTGDYISQRTAEQCMQHILQQTRPGSILVFHDTPRSMPILQQLLPQVLTHFHQDGYQFLPVSEIAFGNPKKIA